jgi:hypothetical protein
MRVGWSILAGIVAAGVTLSCKPQTSSVQRVESVPVIHQTPGLIAPGSVVELLFHHAGSYESPFFDVSVDVDFQDANGQSFHRTGFYHSRQTWAVRFLPPEAGTWRYRYRFQALGRQLGAGQGEFRATSAAATTLLRRNPINPYRFVDATNRPFYPMGLQDCVGAVGSRLGNFGVDGEGRDDHSTHSVTPDDYFASYGKSGFNLLRFSQRNCSFNIHDDLDHYNLENSLATDELLKTAHAHGFRVMFGIFGYHGGRNVGTRIEKTIRTLRQLAHFFNDDVSDASDPRTVQREQRFIRYCVARWGEYVDIWELLNERQATDSWIRAMVAELHAADSSGKLVTTSWEKPQLPEIEINAPHWYEKESEYASDTRVRERALEWKTFGKPVIVGEQGNSGVNWDPKSALRMRIRLWTALFAEIGIVFWNTSWSKEGQKASSANIYLGPEERSYTAVLEAFQSRLDADVHIETVEVSNPGQVRGYGLASDSTAAAYLHHFASHDKTAPEMRLKMRFPDKANMKYEWMDPATGRIIAAGTVLPGNQEITVPSFRVDLALSVTTPGQRMAVNSSGKQKNRIQ